MTKALELIGLRFSRLTVLRRVESDQQGCARWLCECVCGNEQIVRSAELRNGHTRSCGCLHDERIADVGRRINRKHGGFGTPEYAAWNAMNSRCRNSSDRRYQNYGGRGIKVCDRWRKFENFLEDMGHRPSPDHSIDRIDNDDGYEPGNCRWATPKQQSNNRRPRKQTSERTNHA